MSYRIGQTPPRKPNRSVQNLTTTATIDVINGSTAHMGYPAYYIEVTEPESIESRKTLEKYNIDKHKYSKDIRKIINEKNQIPIHFNHEYYHLEDGEIVYDKPTVAVYLDKNSPIYDYVFAEGYIDEVDDHIIRVVVSADIPDMYGKRLFIPFTVVVKDDTIGYRDVAVNGVINVWPAIIEEKE